MIKLILLGSGTSFPLSDRASPSLSLSIGEDHILFDLGPGTLRQLARAGMRHERIQHLFITHLHPDHTADLIHFLFATRHPPVLRQRAPFTITGPRGFNDFLSKLQSVYGKWLSLPPDIMTTDELHTQKTEKRSYENFHLTSKPTEHTPQSLAYRIEGPGGESFVFSGDTGFCSEIVDLAQGVDILILECSFPDGQEKSGHLTPSEAGRIATLAGVRKLVLVHFYPEVLATDIARQCRKTYSGELILGRDLLHLRIN